MTDSRSADLSFRHGLPVITVTLPSRNEPVSFTCPPVTGTIGDLLREIKEEDRGVDHAAVFAQVNDPFINIYTSIFLGLADTLN